jgi:hypothetical protein
MLARRRMLGTTLFGGFLGAAIPAPDARTWGPAGGPTGGSDQSGQTSDRLMMEVVDALKEIKKSLDIPHTFTEIAGIRQKQLDYLKATNKFPDFIDVGLDVWFAVHDWHIKHLQQMVLGRDGSGRYTITLMSTQLVMRPDLVPTFISAPYDNR